MILVDTHVVAWLALDVGRISRKAMTAIVEARRSGEALAISDITLLELATLVAKGRINLNVSLDSFLQEVEERFTVLPIRSRTCAAAMLLPPSYPKDPADRVIGATALVEGVALLTADEQIHQSGAVQTLW